MKARVIILLIALIPGFAVFAQKPGKKEKSPFERLHKRELTFDNMVNQETGFLAYSQIRILDVRQDTARLGFYRARRSYYSAATSFQNEIAAFLNKYYQKNLDPGSPDELVIFIRKLWLTNFDTTSKKKIDTATKYDYLYFRTDAYLRRGEIYYPILRVDTIYAEGHSRRYEASANIQYAFLEAIESIRKVDLKVVTNRKSRTREEIDKYNLSVLYPSSDQLPDKGVYCTFADFKNRKPCYREFEVDSRKLADVIHIKGPDGKTFVKRDLWGYCDGKSVFIKMGDNYFRVYPRQNTWEFFGAPGVVRGTVSIPVYVPGGFASPGTYGTVRSDYIDLDDLEPYQLDMETGKFY